jgi:hypothetical protein
MCTANIIPLSLFAYAGGAWIRLAKGLSPVIGNTLSLFMSIINLLYLSVDGTCVK